MTGTPRKPGAKRTRPKPTITDPACPTCGAEMFIRLNGRSWCCDCDAKALDAHESISTENVTYTGIAGELERR